MKYVQPEPLIVETPDFKCTIEYKCSPDVLVHNYGAGNLWQYVRDLIKDDLQLYGTLKPSQHPTNIISKDQSGVDESFVSITEYRYPHVKVTVKKMGIDQIEGLAERLTELADLIDTRTLKSITNHRWFCTNVQCMWNCENSLYTEV